MSRKPCCVLLMAYIDAVGGQTEAAIRLRITRQTLRCWMRGDSKPCVGGCGHGSMGREHARHVMVELARVTGRNVQQAFKLTLAEMRRLEYPPPKPALYEELWQRNIPWYAECTRRRLAVQPATDALDHAALCDAINEALVGLRWRERWIVILQFGLNDHPVMSNCEIASLFKVTRERIRQQGSVAVRKLQAPKLAQLLAIYLD